MPEGTIFTPRYIYNAIGILNNISYWSIQKMLRRISERGLIDRIERGLYRRRRLLENIWRDEVVFVQRDCCACVDNVRVFLSVDSLFYRRLRRMGVVGRGFVLIRDVLCDLRVFENGFVYVQFRQPLPRGFDFVGYVLYLFVFHY